MRGIHPSEPNPKIRYDVPHSARVWNYWLGGKDNYPVDREIGDAVARVHPGIRMLARQTRLFLVRTVTFLAREAGVRQFLDIGTGLPSMQNTHEVAQSVAADCRVVYVDNDPLVLAHARALLTNTTPRGTTRYVEADLREPEEILAAARTMLNFDEPVAIMLLGVLGHIPDYAEARSILDTLMDAVPAGSYLTAEHSTGGSAEARAGAQLYAEAGAIPYYLREPREVAGYFAGLELVTPGVVPITQWRPVLSPVDAPPRSIDKYGGVGRKP